MVLARLDDGDVTAKCGVFFAACVNGHMEMKYTPSAWRRCVRQMTLVEYCYTVNAKIAGFGDFIYNCIFLSCWRLLWAQLLTFAPRASCALYVDLKCPELFRENI